MTDQVNTPVQGTPVPAPAVVSSDAATLQMLVQLLLAERQQALEERQERQRTTKVRDEQRRVNAEYTVAEKNKSQQLCTHLKGGKHPTPGMTNYAVYHHTFTDQTVYIRCQICGMKWRKLDTAEFLVRGGKSVPNHTGISWQKAYSMLSSTTNTPSSSEVIMSTQALPSDVANLD
jgi:hypothetical protein